MKMHVGVDESLGLIHSLTTTSANVHDITQAGQLLHGKEKRVWGDAGYGGIEKRDEHTGRDVDWLIALRPGVRSKLAKSDPLAKAVKSKARVRAKVEHCFHRIKCQFGYGKARYRGLEKNTNRLYLLAGFTNLLRAEPFMATKQDRSAWRSLKCEFQVGKPSNPGRFTPENRGTGAVW